VASAALHMCRCREPLGGRPFVCQLHPYPIVPKSCHSTAKRPVDDYECTRTAQGDLQVDVREIARLNPEKRPIPSICKDERLVLHWVRDADSLCKAKRLYKVIDGLSPSRQLTQQSSLPTTELTLVYSSPNLRGIHSQGHPALTPYPFHHQRWFSPKWMQKKKGSEQGDSSPRGKFQQLVNKSSRLPR
jgi:hypothetical protein